MRQLPCCTADEQGNAAGDPLNLVLLGDREDMLAALSRGGWSFTHRIDVNTVRRLAAAAISGAAYPVAPISPLYFMGRPQDLALQRARNTITAFGRLGGHVVGFVCNNSSVSSGQIDVDAAYKNARFIRFCNLYNIPVIFMEDTTGFLPGRDQESRGIVQAGRAMLDSIIDLRTPRLLLIIRNAFGGAYAVDSRLYACSVGAGRNRNGGNGRYCARV